MMRALRCLVWSGALVLAGCAPKAYVRPGFLEHPPQRVAVLPFVITYPYDLTDAQGIPSSHVVGRDTFRNTFYYALTPFGYEDVKPADVDRALTATWGPVEEGAWRKASPQELGRALGVDALIYGDIDRLMHFSTPLYTETSLIASLRMVDAASGTVLWRQTTRAADRGGALMQKGQVVDFVQDQVRSTANPSVKFLRVSDDAVRRALRGFPNPTFALSSETSHRSPGAMGPGIRLAVLPFEAARAPWQKGAVSLRNNLAASLQETPFEVVELQRVDAMLQELGWHVGEPLPTRLSWPELAQALGADVLVRGTVTNWGRTYLLLESWVKAELQVELLDGRTGETIWSETRKNTRQAGILKGPTGIKSVVTAPITGLKTRNLDRVGHDLTRTLAKDLSTSPAVLAYLSSRER